MNSVLKDITEYIKFLRECGYCVMLSCFKNTFGDCLQTLLEYEVHQLSICNFLKSRPDMRKKCIKNKCMLEKKLPKCTYYSHCYAGVEEFVYPIMFEGRVIMCVNISGYRGKNQRSEKCAELTEKRSDARFRKLYKELSKNVPDISEINRIIKPLEYMICELYRSCIKNKQANTEQKLIFRKALIFIYENYTGKISCADVARAVGYSEPHLRHIFHIEGNSSIMEYINNVRISQAADMLKNSDCRITDIAYSCGFEDSNYFSTVFRKKYGIPPKTFRKNAKNTLIIQ